MKWNANLYNEKHGFVAEYGRGLLEFVPQDTEQMILDLGCGTGALTAQLVPLGSKVVGVDSSQSMINTAKAQHPEITFLVCDALDLPFEDEWDVVFSNAVFHWIKDHDGLLKEIRKALKPKGVLLCEFGASGNVATIEEAFSQVCQRHGYGYQSKFNFPTVERLGKLLEENGFIIDRIYDFDRPTAFKDSTQGLENWMRQFYASELAEFSAKIQDNIIREVELLVKESLWKGNEWVADYRRLRVVAHIGEINENELS